MIEQVELSSFDLRYENYRVKHPTTEKNLLASIHEQGIREPLQGGNGDRQKIGKIKRIQGK